MNSKFKANLVEFGIIGAHVLTIYGFVNNDIPFIKAGLSVIGPTWLLVGIACIFSYVKDFLYDKKTIDAKTQKANIEMAKQMLQHGIKNDLVSSEAINDLAGQIALSMYVEQSKKVVKQFNKEAAKVNKAKANAPVLEKEVKEVQTNNATETTEVAEEKTTARVVEVDARIDNDDLVYFIDGKELRLNLGELEVLETEEDIKALPHKEYKDCYGYVIVDNVAKYVNINGGKFTVAHVG